MLAIGTNDSRNRALGRGSDCANQSSSSSSSISRSTSS